MTARLCACGCGNQPKRWDAKYMAGHRPPVPLADRLWARVEKTPGCWLWQGHTMVTGYGRMGIPGPPGATALVHRVAYELMVGPIPEGLHIDHLCRVRHCVNPAHLDAVTQAENTRRGMAPAAITARTNVCQRGHDFAEHGYQHPAGYRVCRRCATNRSRELRQQGAAA